MGLVANMSLMTALAGKVPESTCGFLAFLFIIVGGLRMATKGQKKVPQNAPVRLDFFFKSKVETQILARLLAYDSYDRYVKWSPQISMFFSMSVYRWDHRKPTRNSRNGPCRMRAVAAVDQFILLRSFKYISLMILMEPYQMYTDVYGCIRYTATQWDYKLNAAMMQCWIHNATHKSPNINHNRGLKGIILRIRVSTFHKTLLLGTCCKLYYIVSKYSTFSPHFPTISSTFSYESVPIILQLRAKHQKFTQKFITLQNFHTRNSHSFISQYSIHYVFLRFSHRNFSKKPRRVSPVMPWPTDPGDDGRPHLDHRCADGRDRGLEPSGWSLDD